jgi:hypothetical protein
VLQALHLDPCRILDVPGVLPVGQHLGAGELLHPRQVPDVVSVLVGDEDLLYVSPELPEGLELGLDKTDRRLGHTRVDEDDALVAVQEVALKAEPSGLGEVDGVDSLHDLNHINTAPIMGRWQ